MAVDAFIWFTPAMSGFPAPEGETKDDKYKDVHAFEIKDFSFGIENPTTIGSSHSGSESECGGIECAVRKEPNGS